jgi:predicted Zn-dependent protease
MISYQAKAFLLFCLAVLFFSAVSCAIDPVTGRRELMLLSESDEIRLGEKTDAQIVASYGTYEDAELKAYIDDLGQRIARESHRPALSFHFKILDSAVVNAFAVPGGYVYLTRGILSYLNNEAELAGVLGHELGHVAARHSAEQYSKAQLAQVGLAVGTALSEDFRDYAGLAQYGVGMLFLRFSRDNERQADDLGVEYASKAGYDARRMADFFATLQRLHPDSDRSGLPGWFSTHPDPPDRIEAVQEKAREWALRLGASDLKVNREAYLRQLDGLVFGEDPRQGYVDDSTFYHPEMRFQFPVPPGWNLKNTPAQVQMLSKNQDGAILFSLASGLSPQEAARRFVKETKVRVIRFRATKVNGLSASRLICDVATPKGTLRVMCYFIEKEGRIYLFEGFTPQPLFSNYASLFQETMEGFKTLSDQKRIQVMPDRLRIRNSKGAGSLKEALKAVGVSDEGLEETALVNGMALHDTVSAHTPLKVVERGRQ